MLQDSRLLLAGAFGSGATANVITPYSFATNNITAGTKVLAPYVVEVAHQNANGLNSNAGIDLGSGEDVFLRYTITQDQNGANMTTASVTDFVIDIFTTSTAPGSLSAITASSSAAMFLGTLHLNDSTNYPLNYAAGSQGFMAIPPIPNYKGFQYLAAQFTSTGGNITAGGIIIELVTGIDTAKGHQYKSGFSVV